MNPNAFNGLRSLQELHLSFNQLKAIKSNSFVNLKNLHSLYLSSNHLGRIEVDSFNGLWNLNSLNLYNNRLSRINPNTFKCLNRLTELCLSHNQLKELKVDDAFIELKNLKTLNVSGNRLLNDGNIGNLKNFISNNFDGNLKFYF